MYYVERVPRVDDGECKRTLMRKYVIISDGYCLEDSDGDKRIF
jgi:hypothetical protein